MAAYGPRLGRASVHGIDAVERVVFIVPAEVRKQHADVEHGRGHAWDQLWQQAQQTLQQQQQLLRCQYLYSGTREASQLSTCGEVGIVERFQSSKFELAVPSMSFAYCTVKLLELDIVYQNSRSTVASSIVASILFSSKTSFPVIYNIYIHMLYMYIYIYIVCVCV